MNSKDVTLNDMYPVIKEVIENGGKVTLSAKGISMQPMLFEDRDTIVLEKVNRKLKKYDLPFYRRNDGTFVLHRVIKVLKNSELDEEYVICGDNQFVKEYGVKNENIVAVLTEFTRKGKKYTIESKSYKLYCFIWVNSMWGRKKVKGLKRRFKNILQ